ncbi:MAG: DSD1 family PLP-dependent enzyme [Alphaproteobacteria bacterium]|nr:DSD1 family PLP-dependent enzyme [Alphaproteobacteria bacterium]
MTMRPPAEIGMTLDQIDTPALVIDLDAFERNMKTLADAAAAAGVKVRPHAKTHKSPVITLKQMALGAVGACCQKVSEAETLVLGGVPDVLVSNEIVGATKLKRLMALTRLARVAVCVDDVVHIDMIDDAAAAADATIDLLVEVNMGGNRCGVEPGEPALRLVQRILRSRRLRFRGLQAYHGTAQHRRTPAERRAEISQAIERARTTRDLIVANGIPCPEVTGAGTGTFALEAASGVYTELQCGSYIFMDADYARNQGEDGQPERKFEHSLFVLATVMSRPTDDRALCDAGHKAASVDSGFPVIHGFDEAEYVRAADEHGLLSLKRPTNRLRIGEKIKLIPGHCDPTVNLHDWYVGLRGDRVEAIWPVAARGAMF